MAAPSSSGSLDLMRSSSRELDEKGFDNEGLDMGDEGDGGSSAAGNGRRAVVHISMTEDQQARMTCNNPKKPCKDRGHSRSMLLSVLYAVTLILVGLVFPVTEALRGAWIAHHVVGAFLVYLYALSTIFLIYVQLYHVSGNKRRERKERMEAATSRRASIAASLSTTQPTMAAPQPEQQQQQQQQPPSPSDVTASVSFGNIEEGRDSPPPAYKSGTGSYDTRSLLTTDVDDAHEYLALKSGTATLSHEGTSFYLRLGCLLFAIGNLLFVSLKIEYEFGGYLTEDCISYTVRYPSFFHLAFIGVQTFFLFKNTSLVIKKHKKLVRFGLMHVLATNMCIWLRVLVEEVMHGIHEAQVGGGHHGADVEQFAGSSDGDNSSCASDNSLLTQASPYLFPFVLEYSLIAVAAMAANFNAMNLNVTRDIFEKVKKALRQARKKGKDLIDQHHSSGEGNFDKAHVGMFLGMVVLAGVIVSIVLFYYWGSFEDTLMRADLSFQISDIALNFILLVATVVGMVKLFPLGFDLNQENSIDHGLLVISMMGLIVLEIFSTLASFASVLDDDNDTLNIMNAASGILACVQALAQTSFIIDGMQRYSLDKEQSSRKPGRGTVTFLIVVNVAAWVFKTFQEKKLTVQDELAFYGDVAWPLILNISLPFLLFYRFHSSICLADIWHTAYKEEEVIVEREIL